MKGSGVDAPGQSLIVKGHDLTLPFVPLYSELFSTQDQSSKICKDCLRKLPITHFEKANHGTSLRGDCKDCVRAKRRLNYTKPVLSTPLVSKICVKCGIEKPVSEFTFVAARIGGLHSYCKTCKQTLERGKATTRAESKRKALQIEYENMEPSARPLPKVCGSSTCRLVGATQPPENFDKSKIHSTGLRIDCRLCELERKRNDPEEASKDYHSRWYQEHKEELNQRTKEWRDANPEEVRRLHIERRFRNYGVTQEWYDRTLAAQGGGCAMCGSKDPKNQWNTFHVDHNHSCCNKGCHACDRCRRGLLCSPCNTRLGIVENIDWVKKAKAYLRKYPLKDAAGNDQPSLFDGL